MNEELADMCVCVCANAHTNMLLNVIKNNEKVNLLHVFPVKRSSPLLWFPFQSYLQTERFRFAFPWHARYMLCKSSAFMPKMKTH